jgi:hypothetical protein
VSWRVIGVRRHTKSARQTVSHATPADFYLKTANDIWLILGETKFNGGRIESFRIPPPPRPNCS